jgi:1-acyl-sn-glycerol-3-phosphate acyltransferase
MSRRSGVQRPLASRVWYAVSKQVVHALATFLFGARYTGQKNVPLSGGLLILANHQSHLDPPIIGCGLPRRINYLARKDLFGFAPFRWLIESFDAIALDREGLPVAGVRETMRRLKRGEAVLMFPEGTRTWDGQIGPFMPGLAMIAVRSGAAVLPMALEGAFDAWPRTKRFPWLATIHVHFGPLISAEQVKSLGAEGLLAEAERRIRQCHALLRARPVFARRRGGGISGPTGAIVPSEGA